MGVGSPAPSPTPPPLSGVDGSCSKCSQDDSLYDDVSGAQANDEQSHDGFQITDSKKISTNEILLISLITLVLLVIITLCTCYFIRRRIKNKYKQQIADAEEMMEKSDSIQVEAVEEDNDAKQFTNENEAA